MVRPEDGRSVAAERISNCLRYRWPRLDLSNLQLETVPEPLGDLTHLIKLDLSGNGLTALPQWLGGLTHLTELDLNCNGLTVLPEWLGDLTNLTVLDLSGNQLVSPESLENLAALHEFHRDGYRLTRA